MTVAIVTGGSRGIGAAIVKQLAADGYSVVIGYAGRAESAAAVAAEVEAAGGRAVAVRADVGTPEGAHTLISAAGELGALQVLVNNAGVSGVIGRHDEQDDATLRALVDTNVLGVFFTSREAVRVMSRAHGGEGGVIVNVASVAARTGGLPGLAAYAATKGAVVTFTRGLSNEVAGEGVRVVSVSPGTIETDMTTPEIAAGGLQAPAGRLGQPGDIAAAVSYLASPAADFVTGTDLTISGGR